MEVDQVIDYCCVLNDHPFHSFDIAIYSFTNDKIMEMLHWTQKSF